MSTEHEGEDDFGELQSDREADVEVENNVAHLAGSLRKARCESGAEILAGAVLKHSLTPEQKRALRGAKSIAVVVEVPGPAWAEPIATAIRHFRSWGVVDARTGAERLKDRPDRGNDEISRALSTGESCVGISPAPLQQLPTSLIGAADLWVKVTPDDLAISDTILAVTGRRPRNLPPGAVLGLDPTDIVAAIRVGDTSARAVERLRAAAEARTVVDREVADAPPFASLHGYGAAKAWGENLIADLAAWRQGKVEFGSISTRAVLASEPGLGKSTYVRSLAKAAGVPLFATSVGAWFSSTDGHLNSVIQRVDQVFNAARAVTPAMIFLDEIDALPNRANLGSRNRDYWLPLLTHVFLALDSAVSGANAKTIVIGATNHAEHLDAALTRPGRLDKILKIGHPDGAAREGILRAHLHGDLAGENIAPAAEMAVGMTGADLAEAVKHARRLARVAGRSLATADLIEAVAPADMRSPEERRVVAVHEAGHVIGRLTLGFVVSSVSIVERADAGGMTMGSGPSAVAGRRAIEDYIVVQLCGRAAEQTVLGPATTGAGGGPGSDLATAAAWAASIHASYGLADSLVWRAPPPDAARIATIDPALRALVDADLKRLLARAMDLVQARRPAVEAVAERLLRDRHLSGDEIQRVVAEAEGAATSTLSYADGGRQ
ncbi:MAG: AAA family ATPase [Roseiarcus sp.]|jgi:ATP-dependent Zn protease